MSMGVLSKNQQEEKIEMKQRLYRSLKLHFGTQAVSRIAEKTKLPAQHVYRYFKKPSGNAVIEDEILKMLREAQESQQALIEAQQIEISLSKHVD